jgi:hypothetical protein
MDEESDQSHSSSWFNGEWIIGQWKQGGGREKLTSIIEIYQ